MSRRLKDGQLTPAAKAGMQSNDIIVEFNGQPVTNAQDLIQKSCEQSSGPVRDVDLPARRRRQTGESTQRVLCWVNGRRHRLSRGAEEPREERQKESDPKGNGLHLGITLAELTSATDH